MSWVRIPSPARRWPRRKPDSACAVRLLALRGRGSSEAFQQKPSRPSSARARSTSRVRSLGSVRDRSVGHDRRSGCHILVGSSIGARCHIDDRRRDIRRCALAVRRGCDDRRGGRWTRCFGGAGRRDGRRERHRQNGEPAARRGFDEKARPAFGVREHASANATATLGLSGDHRLRLSLRDVTEIEDLALAARTVESPPDLVDRRRIGTRLRDCDGHGRLPRAHGSQPSTG